ncbi:MAG TPA: DUF3579 domain-containing protein [Gammaproteobacteria bacterium]|nr:DUF3579 domain-containing protein [Gammaproteobacteria bacterium]
MKKEAQESERLIIDDQGEGRRKFRPSDWVERISASLASFGADQRLCYSAHVQPCIIQGRKCLVVSRRLHETHPEFYQFVMDFARRNRLRIQEDRRQTPRPVSRERRRQAWHYEEDAPPPRRASSL